MESLCSDTDLQPQKPMGRREGKVVRAELKSCSPSWGPSFYSILLLLLLLQKYPAMDSNLKVPVLADLL